MPNVIIHGLKSKFLLTRGFQVEPLDLAEAVVIQLDHGREIVQLDFSRDVVQLDYGRRPVQADYGHQDVQVDYQREIIQLS